MASNKKVINLGVVLEAGPDAGKFNKILTHEDDMDRVIMPKDVDQMLRYFRKLAQDGVKVRKLVLMGHGTDTTQHLGMLKPIDVDLQSVRNFRDLRYRAIGEVNKELVDLDKAIAAAPDKETRKQLQQERKKKTERLDNVGSAYAADTAREALLSDVEDLMEPDGTVGLINCYSAVNQAGKNFMKHIGETLVSKRGGRVVGCKGSVTVAKIRPTVAALLGTASSYAFSTAGWHTEKFAATGKSSVRCGVPCHNFARYGFCDHARSSDGGPCWMHR